MRLLSHAEIVEQLAKSAKRARQVQQAVKDHAAGILPGTPENAPQTHYIAPQGTRSTPEGKR